MQIIKIILGFLALILAWSLLFRTGIIFRLNSWLKEHIFNDQIVLYSRRRLALLLFLLGVVSLFSGVENVMKGPTAVARSKALLEEAQESFRAKQYQRVVVICRTLRSTDPKNIQVRELEANALWALGDKEGASHTVKIILSLDPQNLAAKKLASKISEKKPSPKK